MTGLMRSEFEELLIAFEKVWQDYEAARIESCNRKRRYGAGRKPVLEKNENKLLFILLYFKTYPLQIIIGYMFKMSQSQANEWIHKLSGILRTALSETEHLALRVPEELKEMLNKDDKDELVIDGAERRIQRPKDNDKQKQYYSGKKKTHTIKNNLIVGVKDRKVKYLSGTYEGKKHDKKICDEENLGFPDGTTLHKDTGFQGYEPKGVITIQPKKKPRGGKLSVEDKVNNSIKSGIRIVVEHVISGVKRCRIVKDVYRNTKEGFDDLVMVVACGLHNFRTDSR